MIKENYSKTVGIFYLLVLSVILFAVIGSVTIPGMDDDKTLECREFDAEWYRILSNGEKTMVEVPGKCAADIEF